MIISKNIQKALENFQTHYTKRLGTTKVETAVFDKNRACCFINSDKIKPGNAPRVFHHGKVTEHVIVLTHGLSDSPYYMEAVGKRFFKAGLNVLLPLLPAHGLKEPDIPLQDKKLDSKWQKNIDDTVEVAAQFGKRISVGGFSTGGTLSFNKILRNPEMIEGGLFLFSGAIDIGLAREASRFSFVQSITRMTDGDIQGTGRDPYKYPKFPNFGAIELSQVIRENRKFSKGKKITQPVFAAHSVHDQSATLKGIIDLLEEHVHKGVAFVISENVAHPELPLDADIQLNLEEKEGPQTPPKANPKFEEMMATCLQFFREEVGTKISH